MILRVVNNLGFSVRRSVLRVNRLDYFSRFIAMWNYLLFKIFSITAGGNDGKYSEPIAYDGSCPEPAAVQNFSMSAFADTWYVICMYPDDQLLLGTCPFGRYTPNGDKYMLQQWYVADDVESYFEGSGKMWLDAYNSAKYTVFFKFGYEYKIYTSTVTATDYISYAVVYSCKYDPETDTHQDFPWILSRTKNLEGASKIAVDKYMENNSFLDWSKLVENDFSEEACSFGSTINLSSNCI